MVSSLADKVEESPQVLVLQFAEFQFISLVYFHSDSQALTLTKQ